MTLLPAKLDQLDTQSYELFQRAQQRPSWSARELYGSGRTQLSEEKLGVAWMCASMGYFTEQSGLVAAAELAAQTEDFMFRLSLATATADEARHADAFLTYALARGGGKLADCSAESYLGNLHATLTDSCYLEKCLMHTMLEGFAADEFIVLKRVFAGDPLGDIIAAIRADEIRHVAIGLDYLRRACADPDGRERFEAHGAAWERRGLELNNLHEAVQGLAAAAGEDPDQLESWFMRRHRARLRGTGMPIAQEEVN